MEVTLRMLRTVHTLARRLDTYYIRLLCRQGVLMKISIDSLSLSLYTSASATAQIKHVFWKCVGDACEMSLFFTGRRMLLFVLTLTAGHQQAGLSP